MSSAIYAVLSRLCLPFVFGYLLIRGLFDASYRDRRRERFGFVPKGLPKDCIWVHTVSAGEAIASIPVVEFLLDFYPDSGVLVTATTPTGSKAIVSRFGDRVGHCYAPYDIPWSVRRFVSSTRPCALFLVETELWPNLVRATARMGAPVYLINARLSGKSARGYSRLGDLTSATLEHVQGIACQYDDSEARFKDLGVPSDKIRTTGSIKFDVGSPPPLPKKVSETMEQLRARTANLWIAGSTHPTEEEVVLAAHLQIRAALPDTILILAPRHVNRCSDVLSLCNRYGLKSSMIGNANKDSEVLIVDQMGVLFGLYRFAKAAFIGGSLEGTGGHNPIEAALHGVPVAMGPDRRNFEEICKRFAQNRCLNDIGNATDLSRTITRLLNDHEEWKHQSHNVREVVRENQGALDRLKSTISAWMPVIPSSPTAT
ncbi:MAG: 3-deoxy-D-manno-octulosonic acid transferase [Gammaproteobacteria bacterium]|nr:3-deoxy-D-manno-octulosonic acid transferase [Gammaproteobacteria bacterium]